MCWGRLTLSLQQSRPEEVHRRSVVPGLRKGIHRTMFCTSCGQQMLISSKACPRCGAPAPIQAPPLSFPTRSSFRRRIQAALLLIGCALIALVAVAIIATTSSVQQPNSDLNSRPRKELPAADQLQPPSEARNDRASNSSPAAAAVPDALALCEAVDAGDLAKVENLLLNGSSPDSLCPSKYDYTTDKTPVLDRAARDGTSPEVVRTLIQAGAMAGRDTALQAAAFQGKLDVVQIIVDAGEPVNPANPENGSPGDTPLHAAALGCQAPVVAFLLGKGAAVNARDNIKETPLHEAVVGDHLDEPSGNRSNSRQECVDVVRMLLQAGADVNAISLFAPRTPLTKAAKDCHKNAQLQVIQMLLDAGANPLLGATTNPISGWQSGENAVSVASKCGNAQVFELIAERAALFNASPQQ